MAKWHIFSGTPVKAAMQDGAVTRVYSLIELKESRNWTSK